MSHQREYYPSDTLKMLNKSEGKAARGGVRYPESLRAIFSLPTAHSQGRHLVGATGTTAHSTTRQRIADRFVNNHL
ncbi:MAG: hypothetical protein ACYTJ0_16345, partial [Planctomycetota bacterium]